MTGDRVDRHDSWGPGTPERLTPAQKQAGIARILAERPGGAPFRVFAFGSLMWNPECAVTARYPATVHDHERRFQIWSTRARGCEVRPGLGLCLLPVPGGRCRGMVLELDEICLDRDLVRLWDREQNSGVYRPTWLTAEVEGRDTTVMTFVVATDHPHFIDGMAKDRMIEIMCRARGTYGENHDYLRHLLDELDGLGVDDPDLRELYACVREKLSQQRGTG